MTWLLKFLKWVYWQNYGRNGQFKENANCSRRAWGGYCRVGSKQIYPSLLMKPSGHNNFCNTLSIFKDVLLWAKLSAVSSTMKGMISWHQWPVAPDTISNTTPACFVLKNLPNYYQCGFAPREKMQNKGTWENRLIHSIPLKVRINQEKKFLKVFFLFPTGFRL